MTNKIDIKKILALASKFEHLSAQQIRQTGEENAILRSILISTPYGNANLWGSKKGSDPKMQEPPEFESTVAQEVYKLVDGQPVKLRIVVDDAGTVKIIGNPDKLAVKVNQKLASVMTEAVKKLKEQIGDPAKADIEWIAFLPA